MREVVSDSRIEVSRRYKILKGLLLAGAFVFGDLVVLSLLRVSMADFLGIAFVFEGLLLVFLAAGKSTRHGTESSFAHGRILAFSMSPALSSLAVFTAGVVLFAMGLAALFLSV